MTDITPQDREALAAWPVQSCINECRDQSKDQLDPGFSRFMLATKLNLEALRERAEAAERAYQSVKNELADLLSEQIDRIELRVGSDDSPMAADSERKGREEGLVEVSRDLVEAVVCTLRALERTTNRVDDWRLDDMREELSANLIGQRRASPRSSNGEAANG